MTTKQDSKMQSTGHFRETRKGQKEDEGLDQSAADVSRNTASTPSDNGKRSASQKTKKRLSQAIGSKIEQEENKITKRKVQDTPSAKKRKTNKFLFEQIFVNGWTDLKRVTEIIS